MTTRARVGRVGDTRMQSVERGDGVGSVDVEQHFDAALTMMVVDNDAAYNAECVDEQPMAEPMAILGSIDEMQLVEQSNLDLHLEEQSNWDLQRAR
jgi:hypothetical protein